VLELEPTEAEGLLFPKPGTDPLPLDELDVWVRAHGVASALGEVDRRVLITAGLSVTDVARLTAIWRKLYERRLARKGRTKKTLRSQGR